VNERGGLRKGVAPVLPTWRQTASSLPSEAAGPAKVAEAPGERAREMASGSQLCSPSASGFVHVRDSIGEPKVLNQQAELDPNLVQDRDGKAEEQGNGLSPA